MDEIMWLCIGILIILAVFLSVRLYQYKRQIRSFTRAVKKRKSMDRNQLVTVDYFHQDILELANVLNEYTKMQKKLALQYMNDRRQLNNVIAGISHDFRTPLTAADGYMQLLAKSGSLSVKDREYLDIAREKITYLKRLSDDFFELSSLEAQDRELEISEINVGNFLSECILQQHEWIEERKLRTDFRLPEEDIFWNTDKHDLQRIMENLFSNVRKYVKSYVGLKVVRTEEYVVIVMENDLENEDEIEIDRVFEAFYRGNARNSEGSGLGLYVVECLSKRLGCEVRAEYNEGLFRVLLFRHVYQDVKNQYNQSKQPEKR